MSSPRAIATQHPHRTASLVSAISILTMLLGEPQAIAEHSQSIRIWLPSPDDASPPCPPPTAADDGNSLRRNHLIRVHHSGVGCNQQARQRGLERRLEDLAAGHGVEVDLEFIPWSLAPGRFESATADPKDAPDISFVPSTWEATLAPHLAPLAGPKAIPLFNQCLPPSQVAIPLGCDVRLFFLWKDWVLDSEVLHRLDRPVGTGNADPHPWTGRDWDFEDVTITLAKTGHPFTVASNSGFDTLHTFAYFLWSHGADLLRNPGRFSVDSALDSSQAHETLVSLSKMQIAGQLQVHHVQTLDLQNRFLERGAEGDKTSPGMIMAAPALLFRIANECANPNLVPPGYCSHLENLVAYLPRSTNGGPPLPFMGGSYLGVWKRSGRPAQEEVQLHRLASALVDAIQEHPQRRGETDREYLHSIQLVLPDDFKATSVEDSPCPLSTGGFSENVRTQARKNCARVVAALDAGRQLPSDPLWQSSFETPAIISKLTSIWAELEDGQRAQNDLRNLHMRLHDGIAWWPRHASQIVLVIAVFCAALAVHFSLRAYRMRIGKREREASLRFALSGEGALALALEKTTVTQLALQDKNFDEAYAKLLELKRTISSVFDQIEFAGLAPRESPQSVRITDLLEKASTYLPFVLRPAGLAQGEAPPSVHLACRRFFESLVVLGPLVLPHDSDDSSTRTVLMEVDLRYVVLTLRCQTGSSSAGESSTAQGYGPRSPRARLAHAADAVVKSSADAKLVWETSSKERNDQSKVRISLPRFPPKRRKWGRATGTKHI